jgi:hypothetical protein
VGFHHIASAVDFVFDALGEELPLVCRQVPVSQNHVFLGRVINAQHFGERQSRSNGALMNLR